MRPRISEGGNWFTVKTNPVHLRDESQVRNEIRKTHMHRLHDS